VRSLCLAQKQGNRTANFGKLELGDRTPKTTPTPSMPYAKNTACIRMDYLMRQYLEPLSLEICPDSLSQGEPDIRQAIALQLYAQNIFTLGQARRLADLSLWEFQQALPSRAIFMSKSVFTETLMALASVMLIMTKRRSPSTNAPSVPLFALIIKFYDSMIPASVQRFRKLRLKII
jgi:predicted HTH domain antitoxin